jgi:ABC-type glycerol-3-phosphate transport system permease component
MATHARARPRFVAGAQDETVANKQQRRVRATDLLIYAVLILAALAFVVPFYWMVVSSFRPTAQFFQLPIPLVPNPPSLENFETLFARSKSGSVPWPATPLPSCGSAVARCCSSAS